MKINNKYFYFDYKNGKYGYNTSSSRGADTFSPFNAGEPVYCVSWFNSPGYGAVHIKANTSDFSSSTNGTHVMGSNSTHNFGDGVIFRKWFSNEVSGLGYFTINKNCKYKYQSSYNGTYSANTNIYFTAATYHIIVFQLR